MIEIRRCGMADVEKLQKLNHGLFLDNIQYAPNIDSKWPLSEKGEKYFRDLIDSKKALCLLAEDEGVAVGYIAIASHDVEWGKGSYAEIENMLVLPEYRSKGVGKRLVDEGAVWAKENGYEKLYVSAYAANERGLAFYKNNGFSPVDVGLTRAL